MMSPVVGGAQIVSDEGTYPEYFATDKVKGGRSAEDRSPTKPRPVQVIIKQGNMGGAV